MAETQPPIWLLGAPFSGATWLAGVLGTHPQLVLPESRPAFDVLTFLFLVDVGVVQKPEGELLDGGLILALLRLLVGTLAQPQEGVVLRMWHGRPQQPAFTVSQAGLQLPHPSGVRDVLVQMH